MYIEMYERTVCPRSSDPFYIATYYIKWVTTSWTDGNIEFGGYKINHPVFLEKRELCHDI